MTSQQSLPTREEREGEGSTGAVRVDVGIDPESLTFEDCGMPDRPSEKVDEEALRIRRRLEDLADGVDIFAK